MRRRGRISALLVLAAVLALPASAFRFKRTRAGRHERWTQVPVQVDERKFVDFGSAPDSNSAVGSQGTVYTR